MDCRRQESDDDEIGGGGGEDGLVRGSGGKNVIFSNCPYDQSKYSDPLIYISI